MQGNPFANVISFRRASVLQPNINSLERWQVKDYQVLGVYYYILLKRSTGFSYCTFKT